MERVCNLKDNMTEIPSGFRFEVVVRDVRTDEVVVDDGLPF